MLIVQETELCQSMTNLKIYTLIIQGNHGLQTDLEKNGTTIIKTLQDS